MKTFEVQLTEDALGIFAYSLVESPAIETEFILLSCSEDQETTMKLSSDEKQNITGLFLIPDKVIPRKAKDGTPYNIIYRRDMIEKLAIRAMSTGALNNVNINHNGQLLSGIDPFEFWIVGDNQDKIYDHLSKESVPAGSLAFTAHVADKATWELIKSSGLKGFSIEMQGKYKELLSATPDEVDDQEKKIDEIFNSDDTDEDKLKKLRSILDA